MPAKDFRITRRTCVEVRPATLVKVGDTLKTRDGDSLTIEKAYRRNGKVVLVMADNTVAIPAGASLNVYVSA